MHKIRITMDNNSIEMSLMEPEERELVQFIYDAIPAEDRKDLTPDDILLVLDLWMIILRSKACSAKTLPRVRWSIWTARWTRRSS